MRLDVFLYENGMASSRSRAKELIEKGAVSFNGKMIVKPSYDLPHDTSAELITISQTMDKYVSRGGYKLESAIDKFSIDVSERIALDVGASTGGFTDCLLQNGARKVYAVDSGKGQLVDKLKKDSRVVVYENYNARYMKKCDFADQIELVTIDVSFISQTLIIPSISEILKKDGDFIALIKPQFEVGKANVGKNGIVKDESLRKMAVENVCNVARQYGFSLQDVIVSPIKGGDGNIEFLAYFKRM